MKIAKSQFSSDKTPLLLGNDEKIPCYVLDNKMRVISQRGMQAAIGYAGSSGDWLKKFIKAQPFSDEIKAGVSNPIKFERIDAGGSQPITYGYEATLLIDICASLLDQKKAGTLKPQYWLYAERGDIIIRASAKVGIIALIDEATGYQEYRAKGELREYFEKFLLDEYGKWTKRFPDEFFEMLFKMKGWTWTTVSKNKKPPVVGHYVNNFVYSRLAPKLLSELRVRNPKDEKGKRHSTFQQWFTEDVGHPKLQEHLSALIALGKASAYNWRNFQRLVNRALPKYGHTGELALDDEIIS